LYSDDDTENIKLFVAGIEESVDEEENDSPVTVWKGRCPLHCSDQRLGLID